MSIELRDEDESWEKEQLMMGIATIGGASITGDW